MKMIGEQELFLRITKMEYKMNIFKIKLTKQIFLLTTILLIVTSCENPTTTACKDRCKVEGEYSCDGKNLQVCEKLANGCLDLKVVKECENGCENNLCVEEKTCNPTCNEWEDCISTTCKLKDNRCNLKSDCKDNKVCDATHSCVEASNDCTPECKEWENCISGTCSLQAGKCNTKSDCEADQKCEANSCIDPVRKRKTKVVVGANKRINSTSFKAKINLGKVRTSKDLKSNSYKIKLGNDLK